STLPSVSILFPYTTLFRSSVFCETIKIIFFSIKTRCRMKVYKLLFRSISLVFLLLTTMGMSCKKGSEGGAPSDLELAVNVFKDGSGRVDFIATANNPDRYLFALGQIGRASCRE